MMLFTRLGHAARRSLAVVLFGAAASLIAACGADTGGDGGGGTSSGADTSGSTSGTDTSGTTSGTEDSSGTTSGTEDSSGTTSGVDTSGADTSGTTTLDSDDDTISDADEGAPDADFDSDGTPNYLDPDSDGDGVADRVEAGDANPATPPVDSDGNGDPDFLDPDADDNGIDDRTEDDTDLDGDGIPNFADRDNDGDGHFDVAEIPGQAEACVGGAVGTVVNPLNFDGDDTPDYLDTDSDNDTITDQFEGSADTDNDGCPDRYDLDSDNDGIPDAQEAGDADPATPPFDSDGDATTDFRDPDSDDDGLSDQAENTTYNTNPTNADSDGDGVTDLIEVAAGTDPHNNADSPRTRGDFFFLVPFELPQDPTVDTLTFRTNFQQADVYFLFDRTGSMGPEISAMRDAVVGIVDELTCSNTTTACDATTNCGAGNTCGLNGLCIEDPAITGCIPSFWTGTGIFGGATCAADACPINNLRSLNADAESTKNAIPTSAPNDYGGDEALFMAVECMSTGTTSSRCPSAEVRNCATSGVGCPGFRADAARILVTITDESNQDPDTSFTASATGSALINSDIAFIGVDAARTEPNTFTACTNTCIYTGDGDCDDGGPNSDYDLCSFGTDCTDCGTRTMSQFTPYSFDLTAIANASNSVDSSGQPFVRAGDATQAVDTVKAAINEIINNVPIRVTIEAAEVDGDDGDALPFLDYLEVNVSGSAECEAISPTEDTNSDSHHDAFPTVRPGRRVCWDVYPQFNDFVEPTTEPQVFQLQLTVRGDGAILDQRRVYFLVPPRPAIIN